MTRIRHLVELASTGIVAAAAVVMVFTYFYDRVGTAERRAETIQDWEAANEGALRLGPSSAKVVITEFIDFECPFCRQLAPTLDSVQDQYPLDVALVIQHLPLDIHPHAMSAAIAAECADRQGSLPSMYRSLFESSDSFATTGWEVIAVRAGLPNQEAFTRCIAQPPDSFPRIRRGIELAARTGTRGTPTVWLNGRVFAGRSLIEFETALRELGLP